MRLTTSGSSVAETIDDRTTRARIRDATIDCIAEIGTADTTARRVAKEAGVSPGLVIHHFGSMEGLREACDDHVAAVIREQKRAVMSTGPNLDVLAALREANIGSTVGYLARVLADDSPAVGRLIDELVTDAEDYIQQGVDAGLLRATADPRGRAVVLTMWSLGTLVLNRHMQRLLGVDLADPLIAASPAIASYAGPVYEILGKGIFTDDFAAHALEAVDGMAGKQHAEPMSPGAARSASSIEQGR